MRMIPFESSCWVRLSTFCAAALSLTAFGASSELPSPAGVALEESGARLAEALAIVDRHRGAQDIISQIEHVEQEQDRLVQNLMTLDGLIHRINEQQLQAVIQKLTSVEAVELARRESESSSGATTISRKVEATLKASLEELDSIFEAHEILEESDKDIEGWIRLVIEDESNKLLESLRISNEAAATDASVEASTTTHASVTAGGSSGNCTSANVAARKVQDAVVRYGNDGIGVEDHARGATIVFDRTSLTYQPPASETLSSVWWSRYIPEDWERWLLPEGWQAWNAKPDFLSHTVGNGQHGGMFRGDVAPPSAILEDVTLPGSCWPMAGSAGRVTLQLPYPVLVTAVSLDHLSPLLATDTTILKSAPKRLRVYGYPSCRKNCNGLGFDADRRVMLKEFEYDAQLGGVQTFEVDSHAASSTCGDAASSTTTEDAPDVDPGSCSAPPPTEPLVGIELVVLENMGSVDYTCLYRFRVHGDALGARG